MAAGGGDVDRDETLEPQQFPRIVELWEHIEKHYPNKQQVESGDFYPDDPLLKLLDPVFKKAAPVQEGSTEKETEGDEEVPQADIIVTKDEENGLLFEEKNEVARTLLQLSGWKKDEDTWCLVERCPQVHAAARYFVEHKLGQWKKEEKHDDASMMGLQCVEEEGDEKQDEEVPELTDEQIDVLIQRLLSLTRKDTAANEIIAERETKAICSRARQMLVEEPNVLEVEVPATLVGDIHGQYFDLLHRIFGRDGVVMTLEDFKDRRFVFLGDFVDRGDHSLLSLDLILLLKIKYPKNIFLLRGNHESRITNNMYGFHEECRVAYPEEGKEQTNPIWEVFNKLFDAMPFAALVGGRVFCCHGGLSPLLERLDKMLVFNRVRDIVPPGPMADITWSDPGMCDGWRVNARGSGYLFGADISQKFCKANNLKFICRAHQCVKEGYRWDHKQRVVTVFSAPNYCWQQNRGAILELTSDLETHFVDYENWELEPPLDEREEQTPNQYFTEDDPSQSPKAAEGEEKDEDE